PVERSNYLGDFNPSVNPLTTPAVEQVGPGAPIPSLYNANKNSFSPRLGVAWDVRGNGKTVVRAGASVLNAVQPTGDIVDTAPFGANFPSIGVNNSGTALNAHSPELFSVPAKQIKWDLTGPVFPGNASLVYNGQTYTGVTCAPANLAVTSGTATPCFTVTVDPNFRVPYTAEWNLDIQRAITNNLTLDVAYVGNHGFKEPSRVDIDQPSVGAGWNTPTAELGGVTPAAYCLASAPTYNQCGFTGTKIQNSKTNGALADNETAALQYPQFPYLNQINQQGNLFFSNYNALQ